MKNLLVLKIFILASTLGNIFKINNIQAQNLTSTYTCIKNQGIPTTIVDTKKGTIELIVWQSDYFRASGWTPQKRCEEVTKRFQRFADSGRLRYIATGYMNKQPIICVAENKTSGFKCVEDGLLITLEKSDNPSQVLNELFNISARVSGGGLTRGSVLDLQVFLEQVPTMSTTMPTESQSEQNVLPCPPVLCP